MTGPDATKFYKAIILGRCPRCGRGPLFSGFLKPALACSSCALDMRNLEAGDGPAVFAILIVGAIVCAGALVVEVSYQPPYWVHAIIWVPTILVLSLGLLRLLKSWLMIMQYRHEAAEARP